MESLNTILKNLKPSGVSGLSGESGVSKKKNKINLKWEQASEFGKYVGLSTTFVLKLFREFGEGKVLALRSDLRDIECDRRKFPGLVVWKLKQ